MSNRPLGVTLLGAWFMLSGLFTIVWNILTALFGVVIVCFAPGVLGSSIWGLITGILNLILGASLWSGRDWAPIVVSILAIIGIVTGILGGITVGSIISIAINVIVLLYMQSAKVKEFFAKN